MEEATTAREQRPGMLAFAVGRVEIADGRRCGPAPGTLIADQHPQSTGLGPAASWVEHRHRGVVGVEGGAGTDMAGDRRGERFEQERGLADPVGQRGARELDPGPGIDCALPVERSVVAVLGHQDMGEQARTRPTPLDRQRRSRDLGDRLAHAAAHPGPDVDHHLEVRGHVFEHFALVVAEPGQAGAATRRAGAGRRVHHPLARQMGRQRLATTRTRRARPGGRPIPGGRGRRLTRLVLGLGFLEIADQQLELINPLRRAAEARPSHQREHRPQLLDGQRLGVELGVACGELAVPGGERFLQRHRQRPQRRRIGEAGSRLPTT